MEIFHHRKYKRSINAEPKTKYLIVGAGLAGCVLARHLEARGEPFTLVGNPARASAADVAAGIINPVTGRWMTKSWRIDEFAPEAREFYRKLEGETARPLYHPIEITRFCLNSEDVKRAKRRLRNPRYAGVLESFREPGTEGEIYQDDHGSLRILGGAWVDLPAVLEALRVRFFQNGRLKKTDFDYGRLSAGKDGWEYDGQGFDKVVFCEGAELSNNPWFKYLPLCLAKGETLLCESPDFQDPGKLLHREKWLLPHANGRFRLGATYDDKDPLPDPTEEGRRQLIAAFQNLNREIAELSVIKHLAGHRPGTADARPLMGEHPREKGLFIFNGLGSKGASLAPTLSRELCEFLIEGKALPPETDIGRFGGNRSSINNRPPNSSGSSF